LRGGGRKKKRFWGLEDEPKKFIGEKEDKERTGTKTIFGKKTVKKGEKQRGRADSTKTKRKYKRGP